MPPATYPADGSRAASSCVTTHKGVGLLTVLALGLLSNKASKPSPMWRASSSCSDTAVALARSLFRKGADFTAAMAFEMATANLVLELSIIMLALLGWQLTLADSSARH